jgi:hypothetical protein
MALAHFVLGVASAVVGPRAAKSVIRRTVKTFVSIQQEVTKAASEAEKEFEAKRAMAAKAAGQA